MLNSSPGDTSPFDSPSCVRFASPWTAPELIAFLLTAVYIAACFLVYFQTSPTLSPSVAGSLLMSRLMVPLAAAVGWLFRIGQVTGWTRTAPRD